MVSIQKGIGSVLILAKHSVIISVNKTVGTIYLRIREDSSCSTALDRVPEDREVIGSNPPGPRVPWYSVLYQVPPIKNMLSHAA